MTKWTWVTVAALLWAATAPAAPTPQQKCDRKRVEAWRRYVSCVENVLAKDAQGLSAKPSEYVAFARCRHRYFRTWVRLQGTAYTGSTCIGSRFTDNGDGTVTDNLSRLTWEKKVSLDAAVSADPHDADNFYSLSTGTPFKENGTAYTSFLDGVNGGGGFGGSNGWRLPTLAELQTTLLDFRCSARSCSCASTPCVDPALDATNTQPVHYWSTTSSVRQPGLAWRVLLTLPLVDLVGKHNFNYVRAVRGGLW